MDGFYWRFVQASAAARFGGTYETGVTPPGAVRLGATRLGSGRAAGQQRGVREPVYARPSCG
ncbi:hypothetical protein ACWD3Z_01045 [Streptomyces sp. NPDC002740]